MSEAETGKGHQHVLTQEQYAVLLSHLRRGDGLEALTAEPGFAGSLLDRALEERDTIEGFLVREKQPLLVALVRRIGHPRTAMDWEDLLQESRLRLVALRHLAGQEIQADGNVEGYLYQAVVNGLRSQHRRSCRERQLIAGGLIVRDEMLGADEWRGKDDPCAMVEQRALWDELRQVVGKNATLLLWQEYVAELPQAQSAKRLGVTTRTVRNRLERARKEVRGRVRRGKGWPSRVMERTRGQSDSPP